MNVNLKSARLAGLPVRMFSLILLLSFLAIPLALPAEAAGTCTVRYTVVSGDTLSGIADSYKVTVDAIVQLNDLSEPLVITVGQSLCIPSTTAQATTTAAATASTKPNYYVSRAANIITVEIKNYPGREIYYVRVDNDSTVGYRYWRLGRIRTNKSGALTQSFRHPKQLWEEQIVNVCIKNAMDDEMDCQYVYNNIR